MLKPLLLLPLILPLILYSKMGMATPKYIEVWFLSRDAVAMLQKQINRSKKITQLTLIAQNFKNCAPMGEGCFHPQLGFIEKRPSNANANAQDIEEDVKLNTLNAIETNLIDCDENYYFDLYCGKAQKSQSSAHAHSAVQVWIDISASFRTVDYSKEVDHCHRRSFVEKIRSACPKNSVSISLFNTSVKAMGGVSSLCTNYGTNDTDRLIQWIKASQAKWLLIITDIDELSPKLESYLYSIGAITKGMGVRSIVAKDLVSLSDTVTSACK